MEQAPVKIAWYRSPLTREELQHLNRRSNLLGTLQTAGYLGLLTLTGAAACLSARHLSWPWVALLFFFHGTAWAFLINGFHEFVHNSVFSSRPVNGFFARLFAFLGWHNPYEFWASHTEHHKYTLHPPDDLEVVLPIRLGLRSFLTTGFINPLGLWQTLARTIRIARGRLQGPWESALFPESSPSDRKKLAGWARLLLAGHATILLVAILTRWWWLPVAITFAPFYGGWLHYLCNNTQHAGLQDNVPDFRLCCRTITLHPLLEFLYWHMNYHTEHHMYAAVPCYRLKALHAEIAADLPPQPAWPPRNLDPDPPHPRAAAPGSRLPVRAPSAGPLAHSRQPPASSPDEQQATLKDSDSTCPAAHRKTNRAPT